jgi:hypothetical protein
MRGLEVQQRVEALFGDWARYWQKPRYGNVLTISIAYVRRFSIKCVTKIGIECVINCYCVYHKDEYWISYDK